ERERVEKALRASEERFQLAVQGAQTGIWDYDVRTGKVFFSSLWKKLFGYDEADIGDKVEDWAQLLHPDEHDRIIKLQDDFLAGKESSIHVEYRLRHKDGSYRWISASGIVVRDEQGKAIRFVGSHADITDRKKAEEALQLALEKIKKMNDQMRAFVADVSHEIRGPLAIIKESLDIVCSETIGKINEEQKECLIGGKRTVDRLIRLLGDLLNLAKMEAGHLELQREIMDVAPFVDELMMPYLSQISKKELNLKIEVASDIGFIWADRDKLSEVVLNLLSNAMKYTPPGGQITIKLTGNQEEVRFEISDTGSGIPKEFLGKIFNKFERVTTERQEGTGLGLPIAKNLVELHQGKIWVESEEGKGSHFIFILPRNVKKIA
ncbi:MAG TPA: PAS domain-containing sensor histidine kinase, partial [Candidatus Omnitrophota bacterium]|nr:PAS domain-containing sensor histidine kinase [Candidatus Omnitrophota bacterium]